MTKLAYYNNMQYYWKHFTLAWNAFYFNKSATQLVSKYLYIENIFTASINSLTVICIILTGK